MARKRLTTGDFDSAAYANPAFSGAAPETKSITRLSAHPPIAQVAGEASAVAALEEVTRSLAEARDNGRMVLSLPLDAIVPDHLLRDRIFSGAEDMAALKASIRAHGQRQPVDVSALPAQDGQPRWGLISGWRRLMALQELLAETGEPRFATIAALVRRPENAAGAYMAMIEENEIRAALSHYERARIVALAVETGVFASDRAALQALFGNVSRAKRSKIGTFMVVYRALDAQLRFPAAIGERLGLRLAGWIDRGFATSLKAGLERAGAGSAAEEQAALERAMASKAPRQPETIAVMPGVDIEIRRHGSRMRAILSGDMVDDRLIARVTRAIKG